MNITHSPAILYPLFALAALTAVVQLLIPIARVGAALRGKVAMTDFKYSVCTCESRAPYTYPSRALRPTVVRQLHRPYSRSRACP